MGEHVSQLNPFGLPETAIEKAVREIVEAAKAGDFKRLDQYLQRNFMEGFEMGEHVVRSTEKQETGPTPPSYLTSPTAYWPGEAASFEVSKMPRREADAYLKGHQAGWNDSLAARRSFEPIRIVSDGSIQEAVDRHCERMERIALAATIRCPKCGGKPNCGEHAFFRDIVMAWCRKCHLFTVVGSEKWVRSDDTDIGLTEAARVELDALAQAVHDQRSKPIEPEPKPETWRDRGPLL